MSARVLVGDEEREDPTCIAMASAALPSEPGTVGVPIVGFLAGACMMRRSAFLALGGYEPRLFLGGEEALLAIDLVVAGWRLAYVPEIVVRHWPSACRDPARRRRDLRRNAVRVAWLRRPLPTALAITLANLAGAGRPGEALRVASAVTRSMPWLLRHRRSVPERVERLLRAAERGGHAVSAQCRHSKPVPGGSL